MLRGSIVALVTPMHADYTVNFAKLAELIEFHIAEQTDAILVMGTTGEGTTLSDEEQVEIVRFTVEQVAGRIPVIANSGSNDTRKAIAKSQLFAGMGVDYLLSITPYYNKTSPNGLLAHFTAIADSVDIPIILYNVPCRTGMSIPIDILAQLAKHPNIAGIKEASGNLGYLMQVSCLLNDDFAMYSGNDDMILPVLAIGGSGVIGVWANIMPRTSHQLVAEYLAGNHEAALAIQQEYLPLIKSLFIETNPIPIKAACNELGFDVGPLRLPLVEIAPSNRARLTQALTQIQEVTL